MGLSEDGDDGTQKHVAHVASVILYLLFYCTTILITDYKYTYVAINGL